MEKGNPERRKLKVNSVGKVEEKPRKDGQGTFKTLNFNANDITDMAFEKKNYAYSVANPAIIPTIEQAQKDDILEVDVRKLTGEGEQGTWTIHQVVQLYKDGQTVGGQKKPWGKSIETVKLEMESKAKNTALMQACKLAEVGKIDIPQIIPYADKFLSWLNNGKPEESKPPVVKEAKPPVEKETKKEKPEEKGRVLDDSELQGVTDLFDEGIIKDKEKSKRDLSIIKTLNDLFKACNEDFNLQPKEVISELGYSSKADIPDSPAECYEKIKAVR